jgi:type II secretory pathway pseudopilin PulG
MRIRPRGDDEGFSLIETLMVTVLMVVVMSVVTSALLMMYRTADNVDAKSVAQSQIATAMQRLDREIRYAKGISAPYSLSGSPAVDFLATQQGKSTCIQLRVSGGNLSQRTWAYPPASPLTLSAWSPLATGVTSTTPFAYAAPTDASAYQHLTVTLTDASVNGSDQNSATFTALNSTRTTGNDYCNSAR